MAESKLATTKKTNILNQHLKYKPSITTLFLKDLDPDVLDIVALAGTLGVLQTDNDELDYNIGPKFQLVRTNSPGM
jgi:hypothetical protein